MNESTLFARLPPLPLSLSLFRSRPVLVGLGCVALGLALLPLTLLYCYQRSLIYGPTRLSPLQYQAAVAALSGPVARIFAPFDALVFEPPAAVKIRGTAVFYHGNQGLGLERAEFLVPMFIARGLRLVIAEYPGYGARSGEPSEQSLVEDGNRLYAAVADRYRDEPLLLVGESLGSGVAVQIAARQSETGGRRGSCCSCPS
jgi:uncharacterized protein